MTAIWRNDGTDWKLLAPTGFPKEAALHTLVEQAPQVLPLAGVPNLVVLGREVQLGTGFADLLAVEPTGRLAVIEVKLASNAEARRAVVAQILAYAAHLHGTALDVLEQHTLSTHLQKRGYDSIAGAVAGNDQQGSFDRESFVEHLRDTLAQGRFRLVLVLDQAPSELVRLVGYLQSVTDKLLIDLVTVSSYDVGGTQIVVPQRVEPERPRTEAAPTSPKISPTSTEQPQSFVGADAFTAAIDSAPPASQPILKRLEAWALELEQRGFAKLYTYKGDANRLTHVPTLRTDNAGLVAIRSDPTAANPAYLSLWRTVFDRRAPQAKERVERLIAPATIAQGTAFKDITDELLDALTDAYAEAGTGKVVASTRSTATRVA